MVLLPAPLPVRRRRSRRGPADGFPVSDIPSVAAAKAVLHPIRLRILETLDGEPRSPRSLAAELDEPLPNLSYHVKTPERPGAIELTGTRSPRGATALLRVRVEVEPI